MEACLFNYLESRRYLFIRHALKQSDRDLQLAEDSLQETLKISRAPERYCKIENVAWIYNTIDYYIKNERKRRKKVIDTPLDKIPSPAEFEDDENFIEDLNLFRERIILFLKNRYPLAGHKYYFYIEIWVYKKLNDETWKEVEQKFKGVDIQAVQSRRSEIMKEFKKSGYL